MPVLTADTLVLLAVAALLPLLVTALTKWGAPDWVKNGMTIALAAVATVLQQGFDRLVNDEPMTLRELGTGILMSWAVAAFAYVKLWKNNPINVSLGDATARVGLSGPAQVQPLAEPEVGLDRQGVDVD